jgi:hypothetical protein
MQASKDDVFLDISVGITCKLYRSLPIKMYVKRLVNHYQRSLNVTPPVLFPSLRYACGIEVKLYVPI